MISKNFGSWEFGFSGAAQSVPNDAIEQAQEAIKSWSGVFPREDSWSYKNAGVPALCVRLDCTLNGQLNVFDIYPNIDGLKMTASLHTRFNQIFDVVRSDWPQRLEDACAFNNSREYGLKLGLWRKVTIMDFDELDWNKNFCLKSLNFLSDQDIYIYHTDKNKLEKQGIGGASTFTKIHAILNQEGTMYCQPYYEPMPALSYEKKLMMYRLFFLYSLSGARYVYAGGLWNSRNNLRIHGASDAMFGLLY